MRKFPRLQLQRKLSKTYRMFSRYFLNFYGAYAQLPLLEWKSGKTYDNVERVLFEGLLFGIIEY